MRDLEEIDGDLIAQAHHSLIVELDIAAARQRLSVLNSGGARHDAPPFREDRERLEKLHDSITRYAAHLLATELHDSASEFACELDEIAAELRELIR